MSSGLKSLLAQTGVKVTILFTFFGVMLCTPISAQKDAQLSKKSDAVDYADVRRILDSVYVEDQKYRKQIEEIDGEYEWNSPEMSQLITKMINADRKNIVIVQDMLAKYGWLGANQVGDKANAAQFLVIQHADLTIQEKYLPMMKKAVSEGKARSQSLALLEDRILLGNGEPQIYGSQVGTDEETGELYVFPMIYPRQVNKRRAQVGLGTIEEYLSFWELEWDVESYIEQLPARKEKLKERQ